MQEGQPTAYIVGEEMAGSFVGGLRYGEGTIYYKTGEKQRIYWQGPSVGFDWVGPADVIEKIDEDDYGFCEACGVEIGIRRLEARPTATLCIDCKTLDELRERQVAK